MFLYQPASGYRYNSDSIFLYDFAASFEPKNRLLDVGCGVGILSLLLSRDFALTTAIVDKQENMLSYARHNFFLNGLEAEAYQGDFLSFKSSEKYDTIISNPPFYDREVTQSKDKHLNAARYAHHLPFVPFAKKVKTLLKPRGRFVFCYDAKQIDRVLSNLKLNNINPEVIRFVHPKIDRESKLVMIAARINSRSMTKVMPPLIVFDAQSRYLPEAKRAFERAGTHSVSGEWEDEIEKEKDWSQS
ncbi:MAG: methyltransferase [Campylobacterota bacterium]|nr:methyltransferase [Campylobacterota bacterium]